MFFCELRYDSAPWKSHLEHLDEHRIEREEPLDIMPSHSHGIPIFAEELAVLEKTSPFLNGKHGVDQAVQSLFPWLVFRLAILDIAVGVEHLQSTLATPFVDGV